jgi:hypothetical protein
MTKPRKTEPAKKIITMPNGAGAGRTRLLSVIQRRLDKFLAFSKANSVSLKYPWTHEQANEHAKLLEGWRAAVANFEEFESTVTNPTR